MYIYIYMFSGKPAAPGSARVRGSGKATAIWSLRHCKPAACILMCGFPC